MTGPATVDRRDLIRRGQRLEYFTVAWNSVEALVSIVAGMVAGSVVLVGFGLDSVIEVASPWIAARPLLQRRTSGGKAAPLAPSSPVSKTRVFGTPTSGPGLRP